jgi:uncharacterized coiled-coil DUF342 family protein
MSAAFEQLENARAEADGLRDRVMVLEEEITRRRERIVELQEEVRQVRRQRECACQAGGVSSSG